MTTPEVRAVAWDHPDAVALREAMSTELGPRYADRRAVAPVSSANQIDSQDVVYTGVAYVDGRPAGHVVLRRLGAELELKRMFVAPAQRGAGVGRALLTAAENAARELNAGRIILATGDRQPDAVALYTKAGYQPIPLFAPYLDRPYSLCFAKVLPPP